MSKFSTFGFLNPFVQSRWKERAKQRDADQAKLRKKKRKARASQERTGND